MRYTTQFLLSAMAADQFPAPDVPEIAFLGRSNVGKSSLLNGREVGQGFIHSWPHAGN
jgi:GTP-binding protein